MDPRKGKNVATGSRGRGRANRPQPIRVPQTPVYRPLPPSPHDVYYTQPPSYPYNVQPPPMNPYNYIVQQTAEFDPFPMEEEPVEEAEEEEFVAETQPPQNEVDVQEVEAQNVSKKKFLNRAEKKSWTAEEEEALAKAWIQVSTCRVVGNEQGKDGFWKRILEHFKTSIRGTTRSHHALTTKWRDMNTAMNVFNGFYHQSKRLWESGCNDLDVMNDALGDYNKKTGGKPFTHTLAWNVVKDQAKWLEQTPVGQTTSSHSDKRRKSMESGHYESASNDLDTSLPNLNEDPTPPQESRQRKGKKTPAESSSKGSVVDWVHDYTSKKAQILEVNALKTQQLLDQQLRQNDEKALYRDHKFFIQPHDTIADPQMREWTIQKKREIAAKHGWACNF